MAVEVRHNSTFVTDNFRVHYSPSNEPADVESHCYIRQNPWKKGDAQLYPLSSGLLSLPYAHTKSAVEEFNANGTIPEGFPKKIAALPIGTNVYTPDGHYGNIIKIVSEVKAGILPFLKVVRKPRNCSHTYTEPTYTCQACADSVVYVGGGGNTDEFLGKGYLIEPYYTLYRECDPVATLKIEYEEDLRKYAGCNSFGMKKLYWKRNEQSLEDYDD